MLPDNFPAFTNGLKNNTKLSLVMIERNREVEKKLKEYQARQIPKVSLRKVAKMDKKKTLIKSTISPVNKLQKKFLDLKKETDGFLEPDLATFDSDPPTFESLKVKSVSLTFESDPPATFGASKVKSVLPTFESDPPTFGSVKSDYDFDIPKVTLKIDIK